MIDENIEVDKSEKTYDNIDISDVELDVNQDETVQIIEVEDVEFFKIEIDDAFSALGETNEQLRHQLLNGRDAADQHPISAITKLGDILDELSAVKNIYTKNAGLAEFRVWSDGNPLGKNRTGYFVSIVNNDGKIAICDGNHDVYGVVVAQSGICGYQDREYDYIDTNTNINKADNWAYAKVCIVGDVQVRYDPNNSKNSNISIGDYVLPDSNGYAIKSDNGIGFRVSSLSNYNLLDKNETATMTHFVNIALVPQNDNISRVIGKIKDLQNGVDGISINIGEIQEDLNGIKDGSVTLQEDFQGLKDLVNELSGSVSQTNINLANVEEISQEAKNNADSAVEKANRAYNNAVAKAESAKIEAQEALLEVNSLKNDLTTLSEWSDGNGSEGIVGFVAQANANNTQLSNLIQQVDNNGNSIVAVQQKINENGSQISHLVAHADKYSVGSLSISNGLTDEIAREILHEGHIYVSTSDHEENSVQFSSGKVYRWTKLKDVNNNYIFKWREATDIKLYTNTETIPIGTKDGDLWFCWQGILDDDNVFTYQPETLYRWDDSQWISVATIDGNISARTIGLIIQTDEKLSTSYTNLRGDVSTINQTVNEISASVLNVDGQGSTLQQTVDEIIMGTFEPEQSTSLGLMLSGFFNETSYNEHICTNEFKGVKEPVGNRYSVAPIWDENQGKFVFNNNYITDNGEYYFYSDDHMRYCKAINDGYRIYTIGNVALATLNARADKNETSIDLLTKFQTDTNTTVATYMQRTDADEAESMLATQGKFIFCSDIISELTDDEKIVIVNINKYSVKPKWNTDSKCFEFSGDYTIDGIYYMPVDNNQIYHKIIKQNEEIIGYEVYKISSSGSAYLAQKVNENSSSIGMVVDHNGVKGSVIAQAVNNQSEVLIAADKIGINGTAVFRDNLSDGSTTISGNYIKTGVLTSSNYTGPVTYRMYGVKIEDNMIKTSETLSDCIYYTPVKNGKTYVILPEGTYYKAGAVQPNEVLSVLTGTDALYTANFDGYIVNTLDFDAKSENEIEGTKIDLNNGVIFSKNLLLNRDGDLSVTGNISATSGYIGNGINGFIIGNEVLTTEYSYAVNQILEAGEYDFKIGDKYYSFVLNNALSCGDVIVLDLNKSKIKIWKTNNSSYPELSTITYVESSTHTDGVITLNSTSSDLYYLANNQLSLKGNESGEEGVYISPVGIGLGNGNFYVDKLGNLNTFGNVIMYRKVLDDNGIFTNIPIVQLDKENGNLTLSGNITLGGNITWDMTNSPIKSQYSLNYTDDNNDENDDWHDNFQTGDKFMRMSFDGGKTWNIPTKIVGEDGMNGLDGTDASVTPENVFNALTNEGATQGIFSVFNGSDSNELYINAEYIKTGTLSADRIRVNGDDVVTSNDGNLYIKRLFGDSNITISGTDGRTYPGMYYLEMQSGFEPWSSNSNRVGADLHVKKVPGVTDGILQNYESIVYGFQFDISQDGAAVNFVVGAANGYADVRGMRHSVWGYNYDQGKTYPKGVWDFSSCTVTGINLYFE